jgi:hypothetical protein
VIEGSKVTDVARPTELDLMPAFPAVVILKGEEADEEG